MELLLSESRGSAQSDNLNFQLSALSKDKDSKELKVPSHSSCFKRVTHIIKPYSCPNLDQEVTPVVAPDEAVSCKCGKTRCLRLYCPCFAANKLCRNCACCNCQNTEQDLAEVVQAKSETATKNPLAFQSKFKSRKKQVVNARGCNCARSSCIKNYCECFQKGTGCSRLCKCRNCKNAMIDLEDHEVAELYEKQIRRRLSAKKKQKPNTLSVIFE